MYYGSTPPNTAAYSMMIGTKRQDLKGVLNPPARD